MKTTKFDTTVLTNFDISLDKSSIVNEVIRTISNLFFFAIFFFFLRKDFECTKSVKIKQQNKNKLRFDTVFFR